MRLIPEFYPSPFLRAVSDLLCLSLCVLACQPVSNQIDENSTTDAVTATPVPAIRPTQSATLPADSSGRHVEYAIIDVSETQLRAKPNASAQSLGRLRQGDAIEVRRADGAENRAGWLRVRSITADAQDRPRYLEGWIPADAPGRLPDGSFSRARRGGEHTPLYRAVPARRAFGVQGKSFSFGTGCSGLTYSEYHLVASFQANTLDVVSKSATIHSHASPSGEPCSTVDIDDYRGSYTLTENGAGSAPALTAEFSKLTNIAQAYGSGPEAKDDCRTEDQTTRHISETWPVRLAYCYQSGRTVPGLLAPPPGSPNVREADAAFWALVPEP